MPGGTDGCYEVEMILIFQAEALFSSETRGLEHRGGMLSALRITL